MRHRCRPSSRAARLYIQRRWLTQRPAQAFILRSGGDGGIGSAAATGAIPTIVLLPRHGYRHGQPWGRLTPRPARAGAGERFARAKKWTRPALWPARGRTRTRARTRTRTRTWTQTRLRLELKLELRLRLKLRLELRLGSNSNKSQTRTRTRTEAGTNSDLRELGLGSNPNFLVRPCP